MDTKTMDTKTMDTTTMDREVVRPDDLAFYTYFYGSDKNLSLSIPDIPSLKYKCFYFTNNRFIMDKLKYTQWIGVYHDISTTDDLIESCMIGKHIKTKPHEYPELNGYTYLCGFDSKMEKVSETFVENMIAEYFVQQDYALLLREHPFINHSVWIELDVSIKQERYRKHMDQYKRYIENQVEKGFTVNTPKHGTCNFLLRNMKHAKTVDIGDTWFQHIQECGIQDQISFFFVKQLFPECIHFFTESVYVEPFQQTKVIRHVGKYTYGVNNITIKRDNNNAFLKIGAFCSIAESLSIFLGGDHRVDWITTYPFGHNHPETFDGFHGIGHPQSNGNVIIENDVWIGTGVTIMSGITIGNGAVIAANSHVVKNVEPYSIVGGNPAKHIRFRFTPEQIDQLLRIQWWNWDDAKINASTPLLCSGNMDEFIRLHAIEKV